MKQEDGKGIGDPVHKYYFFPSEARDFSRGYFTFLICNFFTKITNIYCFFMYILLLSEYGGGKEPTYDLQEEETEKLLEYIDTF